MTPAAQRLVADFEAAAKASLEAEAQLRKSMAEELARLERERATAFRRTRLVRLLASSSAGAEDEDAALAAQSLALGDELSLSAENPAHGEILERLRPVGKVVWQCACGDEDEVDSSAADLALREFEDWFQAARGQSFYALFDVYVPETPLVDF